jgi:hypothetical protein
MYRIEGNGQRPTVIIDKDKGLIELSGSSIMENPLEVFIPVFNKIAEYVDSPRPKTTVNLKLTYFNTSSSKLLLDLIQNLEAVHAQGKSDIKVYWYYHEDDENMMEIGEDFAMLCNVPIEILPMVEGE